MTCNVLSGMLSIYTTFHDKREDHQSCSVLYCIPHLCPVIGTLMWSVLACELRYVGLGLCVFLVFFVMWASLFVWGLFFLFLVDFISLVASTSVIDCLEHCISSMTYYYVSTLALNSLVHWSVHYLNPLKCSGIRWLHFEVFSAIQVNRTFLISDIRALWCSALSARVPECQKLKM